MAEENYFVKLFKKIFINLHEVTIYEIVDGVHCERKFTLSRIDKLNKQHIKGVDEDGMKVEYFSKDPFSYYVKQLY